MIKKTLSKKLVVDIDKMSFDEIASLMNTLQNGKEQKIKKMSEADKQANLAGLISQCDLISRQYKAAKEAYNSLARQLGIQTFGVRNGRGYSEFKFSFNRKGLKQIKMTLEKNNKVSDFLFNIFTTKEAGKIYNYISATERLRYTDKAYGVHGENDMNNFRYNLKEAMAIFLQDKNLWVENEKGKRFPSPVPKKIAKLPNTPPII